MFFLRDFWVSDFFVLSLFKNTLIRHFMKSRNSRMSLFLCFLLITIYLSGGRSGFILFGSMKKYLKLLLFENFQTQIWVVPTFIFSIISEMSRAHSHLHSYNTYFFSPVIHYFRHLWLESLSIYLQARLKLFLNSCLQVLEHSILKIKTFSFHLWYICTLFLFIYYAKPISFFIWIF